ncbi:hypothetical protein KR054_006781 [Drosophila jambulina]|nr:hypothetical protein KR054_006781 [Drosophila jambulina]
MASSSPIPVVFENGTVLGSMGHERSASRSLVHASSSALPLVVPNMVINSSQNISSLRSRRLRHDNIKSQGPGIMGRTLSKEDVALGHASLLHTEPERLSTEFQFEQFILDRTISENNIREPSPCSELRSCSQVPAPAPAQDILNSSASSQTDSECKRLRKTFEIKSKRTSTALSVHTSAAPNGSNGYPPQYTAIFLDPHLPGGSAVLANDHMTGVGRAPPVLDGNSTNGTNTSGYLHYHQYCHSRPIIGNLGLGLTHHHQHLSAHHDRRTLFDVAVPLPRNNEIISLACNNLPVVSRSRSTVNVGFSLRKWFARPSLPFVIGIFALGGVACTLGGIVLGSTGLIEHSTQYLSAALLMIGIGVSLLVISGAIWRLSLPDDVDECNCFRRMESCHNCNSPQCNNRVLSGSYIYPEFHHHPPPPSYLTSINEYAFFYHHTPCSSTSTAAYVGINTPPPMYQSTYSLK